MATPTVAEVLTGYKAGTYTLAQAEAHIGVHIAASAELNTFAGLAMQSLMSNPSFFRQAKNKREYPTAVATEAFRIANAMKRAST